MESKRDEKLYIGWTINLVSRLKQHNRGKVKATKYRAPLKLVYFEACLSKNQAIKREKSLKTGFGRKYLKNRIE